MIKRTHIFKDVLIKLCFAQKASLDAGEGFLQHFLHAAQAGDGDATWLEKGPKSGPKSSKIDDFLGSCPLPLLGRVLHSSFFASFSPLGYRKSGLEFLFWASST